MAVAKSRGSKTVDPWKSKRWYPIFSPKYMKSLFIGETPASEKEKIVGREVKLSLSVLTGEIKKQNVNVTFRIVGFEGNNATTELKRFEISSAYIKRQIRKGRERIDDMFKANTSDNKEVVIKPLIITKNKTNNSKKTLLRKLARQEIKEYLSKVSYNQLVQDLLVHKMQKTINQALRKVCPLKNTDIRVMSLVTEIEEEGLVEEPAEQSDEEKNVSEEKAPESKPEKNVKKKAVKKTKSKKSEEDETVKESE